MYLVLTIIIIAVAVLLTLVVLVQNSKGGGLSSGFTGSNQIMGVQRTTDFIEKLTWGLAIALVALCLMASFSLPDTNEAAIGTQLQEQVDKGIPAKTPPAATGAQPLQPAAQPTPAK
ncbi:MAG: hypothetical protein RIQ89_1261 [Bacteroidota bacterium]|jgi:preprotein translocase subunit SecG